MKKIFITSMAFCFLLGKIAAQSPTDGMVDAITQMGDGEITNIQNHWEHLDNMGSAITEGLGHLNTMVNIANSARDLYNASLALDNNECVPDLNVDASHMMPTSCAGSGECQSCYSGAYRQLAGIRRLLARLRCIYMNTRTFTESALAFGDNTSGIHAVTGLAWQSARADIVGAYESFKQTYDRKYEGMIGSLQQYLMDISRCEDRYGQPDWYQRFGFIYFEMMKEKYKRTD